MAGLYELVKPGATGRISPRFVAAAILLAIRTAVDGMATIYA